MSFLRILFPILRIKRRCITVVEMQEWQIFSHNFSAQDLAAFGALGSGEKAVSDANKKFYMREMTPLLRPL